MQATFTPGQLELRDEFRGWLDGRETDHLRAAARHHDLADLRDWQRTLYDAGWLGFGWPTEQGGRGQSTVEHILISQELARRGLPQPIGLIGLEIVGPSLLRFGRPDQIERFAPRLLRGDDLWCQGFSEPEAGSDLASLRTSGVRQGDELIINGQKIWTSYGAVADWCALLVRTDPAAPKHAGLSYVLVDMSSVGISTRPIQQATGEPGFAEVFFDDVRVPVANLLGAWGQGWAVALDTLDAERGPFTVRKLAELRHQFELLCAVARSGSRAEPVDSEAERLGGLAIWLDVLEAQCYRIVHRLIEGERTFESSIDKLLATEVEQQIARLGLDILSPLRTSADDPTHEHLCEQGLRDYQFSRVASIYGGTSQVQQQIIARRMLGLPRSSATL